MGRDQAQTIPFDEQQRMETPGHYDAMVKGGFSMGDINGIDREHYEDDLMRSGPHIPPKKTLSIT